MSAEAIRKVNVIGHLNPDTDSICSAIAYAYLKNQIDDTGTEYEARRAGAINRETSYVLRHFGYKEPRLITSVAPQIKDLEITPLQGIGLETSLHVAWNLMRDTVHGTLCIVDNDDNLTGLVAIKDIANANMATVIDACVRGVLNIDDYAEQLNTMANSFLKEVQDVIDKVVG